jgi:uncharacterized membrane protein YhaH (DUF805 family)
MNWYLAVLKKYAVFGGRARRQEYWMFVLVNVIISAILNLLADVADSGFFRFLDYVYGVAVLIPSLAVLWRRLHDTDRTGAWFLLVFLPVIGWIWLLVLVCLPGTPGPNRYGPNPKAISQYA